MDYSVNWLSVVVGAAGSMLLGWLWYSPLLFGKRWAELTGSASAGEKQGMGKLYIVTFIGALITSYVINILMGSLNVFSAGEAILTVFVLWLGLVGVTTFSGAFFERRPSGLWAINALHLLTSFILIALIAVLWPY